MQPIEQAPHPGGGLSVIAAPADGVCVLTLAGEIDHDTGETLRQALDLSVTGQPRIVADLRQVTFMDSSGINILLTAHHAATEAGGRLRLAAPTPAVLRTLQIVGIDQIIDCHPTLQDALDH
ncbi:STAS domain-containing protein [Streptomyces caelestis]|uniref:Anti-sigma factor antagonist n=1 Tax=Streptomyces heliomycini TaxID=284032 RepID=A0ABV5LHF7_9ACTN|nr:MULTISPECIES: STAS domain-containing protein [Streptomyces]